MKEAVFQYKCRMCGVVFDDCRTGSDFALMNLISAMLDSKTIGTTNLRAVDKMALHHCDETRVGLADLIGYRIEG